MRSLRVFVWNVIETKVLLDNGRILVDRDRLSGFIVHRYMLLTDWFDEAYPLLKAFLQTTQQSQRHGGLSDVLPGRSYIDWLETGHQAPRVVVA